MEGHAARAGDHHGNGRSFLEGALMNELGERILRWLDGRELVKFALLAAVLGAVVGGIAPLIFRSDTALFLSAAFAGLSIGWITGRLPLPAAAAGFVDAALGIDFLFVVIGRLDIPLRNGIGSLAGFLLHLLPQNAGAAFDAGPLFGERIPDPRRFGFGDRPFPKLGRLHRARRGLFRSGRIRIFLEPDPLPRRRLRRLGPDGRKETAGRAAPGAAPDGDRLFLRQGGLALRRH